MRNKHFSFPVNPLVGSSVSNIFTLWRKHRVDLTYIPKFLLTIIVAGIFEIFNLWEKWIIGKKLKKRETTEPPVFIIGFWRSGTTLLHNIMCRDPKAGYTTTFHVVFPHSTITQAWWLKKLTNLLLPATRPFDNVSMDMDFPQEEEYGMAAMQDISFYNFFTFPKDFDQIFKDEFYTQKLHSGKLKKWQKNYQMLIKKALLNTNGTRYTSKNPCNLGRIELLLSMFPEARFIFIYRNPYQVVESLFRFALAVFPGTQLQEVPENFNREKIIKLYTDVINQYFLIKSAIPEGHLFEVKMEDFVKDKIGYLEKIYHNLKISGFEKARPYFEEFISQASGYTRESYGIPQETYDSMNHFASDLITRLGYEIKEN